MCVDSSPDGLPQPLDFVEVYRVWYHKAGRTKYVEFLGWVDNIHSKYTHFILTLGGIGLGLL